MRNGVVVVAAGGGDENGVQFRLPEVFGDEVNDTLVNLARSR